MDIGSCGTVSNLLMDLCLKPHHGRYEPTIGAFGDCNVDSTESSKKHEDVALRYCLSRFVSQMLSSTTKDQNFQHSVFRRFQSCALVDMLFQENKSNSLGVVSSYV